MESDNNTIKCPECGAEISVTEILYHQVHDSIKKDFDNQMGFFQFFNKIERRKKLTKQNILNK